MRSKALTLAGLRLARWRGRQNVQSAVFWIMLTLGPLLALATFVALGEMERLGDGQALRAVLLADFVYALAVAGIVARRVAEMIAERRRRSAG